MNQQDDPEELFRMAEPDTPPPPAAFDLDQIVSDGYRARRRSRVALGGGVTAGVAAIAAVLAFSAVGSRFGGEPDPAESPDAAASSEEEAVVEDPETAGYPYRADWGMDEVGDTGMHAPGAEQVQVKDAATQAFGQLLVDAGLWEDEANRPPEEDCEYLLDADDPVRTDDDTEDARRARFEACMDSQGGMPIGAEQTPGNYGQTYLRSYRGSEVVVEGDLLRHVFALQVRLPGGWTAEPGPITEQVFPQHLISDGPYFTDQAPQFTTDDLGDGRTVMVADHGCAAEVAVTYPNGTGLLASWDDCSGADYPLDLPALIEAAESMPELTFDTAEMVPTGDLVEVPTGWVYDEGAWEDSSQSQEGARDTFAQARGVLQDLYPEATLGDGGAVSSGLSDRGAIMHRTYSSNGSLPFETTIDETVADVDFSLSYTLPGGFVPGYSETGHWDPHLTVCKEDYVCTTVEGDDGTVVAFEHRTVTHEPMEGETWEAFTEQDLYVTLYDPEGWAVGVWLNWTGDTPVDEDMVEELVRAMPAPVYDADDVPSIPEG